MNNFIINVFSVGGNADSKEAYKKLRGFAAAPDYFLWENEGEWSKNVDAWGGRCRICGVTFFPGSMYERI